MSIRTVRPVRSVRHTAAFVALAAALTLGATVAAPAAQAATHAHVDRAATVIGTGTGNGATLAIAEQNAETQLSELFYGCGKANLVSDYQRTNGIWFAEVKANCQGPF